MSASGLVALKRYRAGAGDPVSRGSMQRVPSLDLQPSEVLSRYRGLDGQPWPSEFGDCNVVDGLASLGELDGLVERLTQLRPTGAYDLLHLGPAADEIIDVMPPQDLSRWGSITGSIAAKTKHTRCYSTKYCSDANPQCGNSQRT